MNVYVPDGYKWNYLDLDCANQDIFETDSCNDLTVNCINNGRLATTYAFAGSPYNDWRCSEDSARYCCPYYDDSVEVGECFPGENCTVDCTDSNCDTMIIDGSLANSLTVSCGDTDCQYSVFYCPSGINFPSHSMHL